MGRKDKNVLGRALVKDKFGSTKGKRKVDNGSMLHTTEVQDGYDWGRLNLQSVTEESSFQEFLSTAELAGTEFQAEKLNLRLVAVNNSSEAVSSLETRASVERRHAAAKHLLRVPRKPAWSKEMTAEDVKDNEKQAFLSWRRELAILQEKEGLLLTPYEKNLEFWRQLWRVLERSHILVQVLDARNPLLFRCEDLEAYAKEIGISASLLILNKADLLSEPQRQEWAKYFDKQGIKIVFFSAMLADEQIKLEKAKVNQEFSLNEIEENDETVESNESSDSDDNKKDEQPLQSEQSNYELPDIIEDIKKLDLDIENTACKLKDIEEKLNSVLVGPICPKPDTSNVLSIIKEMSERDEVSEQSEEDVVEINSNPMPSNSKKVSFDIKSSETEIMKSIDKNTSSINWTDKNNSHILTRDELIELFKTFPINKTGKLSIGMVGYPNVGKSSTINALMEAKKVSVSATPGKTKHFQTLILSDDLMLVDCPGLVLPSFVCTKADMILHGILPLDQMKEYMDAVQLLVEGLGSRESVEKRLSIMLPPAPSDKPEFLPPRDLLLAYAYSRGMMTGAGAPDCARAARVLLRAACSGKLPLAIPPPDVDPVEFRRVSYPPLREIPAESNTVATKRREMTPKEKLALKSSITGEDVDKAFFHGPNLGGHIKGKTLVRNGLTQDSGDGIPTTGKPWKQINKHANKKKREKLRKVYHYLDQH